MIYSGWCWIQVSIFSTVFCDCKLAQAHQLVFEAKKENHNLLNLSSFSYVQIQVLFPYPLGSCNEVFDPMHH